MKPGPFVYHRASSTDEAVSLLRELGEDAKLLAGGQSLVPMMNFRLARPEALVDIGRITSLRYVDQSGDVLRIGALTTHQDVERCRFLHAPLAILSRVARLVGHHPIRVRGTFGGSLAHADPSAEWCLVSVLLDAEIVVAGPGRQRSVPAREFFEFFHTTALAADEMILEVRLPQVGERYSVRELSRRAGDFAVVVMGAALTLHEGAIASARVVAGGAGPVPARLPAVEELLTGERPAPALLAAAGRLAASNVEPTTDVHGTEGYKRDIAGVLTERVLADCVAAAAPSQ